MGYGLMSYEEIIYVIQVSKTKEEREYFEDLKHLIDICIKPHSE